MNIRRGYLDIARNDSGDIEILDVQTFPLKFPTPKPHIFAIVGVFATIDSVIYVNVHSLHVFIRFRRPPPATVLIIIRFHPIFLVTISKVLK